MQRGGEQAIEEGDDEDLDDDADDEDLDDEPNDDFVIVVLRADDTAPYLGLPPTLAVPGMFIVRTDITDRPLIMGRGTNVRERLSQILRVHENCYWEKSGGRDFGSDLIINVEAIGHGTAAERRFDRRVEELQPIYRFVRNRLMRTDPTFNGVAALARSMP